MSYRKVDHQMAEVFELEEELLRFSSDVKDKYEREIAETITGRKSVPVRTAALCVGSRTPFTDLPCGMTVRPDGVVRRFQQLATVTSVPLLGELFHAVRMMKLPRFESGFCGGSHGCV